MKGMLSQGIKVSKSLKGNIGKAGLGLYGVGSFAAMPGSSVGQTLHQQGMKNLRMGSSSASRRPAATRTQAHQIMSGSAGGLKGTTKAFSPVSGDYVLGARNTRFG